MRRFSPVFFLPLILCLLDSCSTSYRPQSVQYKDYRIEKASPNDPVIAGMIKPYSDSVNKSMNTVIGWSDKSLDKKSPESTLGNFMVDAFYAMAKQKFKMPIDAAFMNYGGIRLTQLPQGEVTRGKIFELMPFDNILVVQRIKGSALQQFLDLIAAKGGWPVAGMTMQVKDKKAINVMIGGKPLDPDATYSILNSDFVANGGDNAEMLKVLPQENIGYLMRDALFDYISWRKSQGKNIDGWTENRVTNAE